MHALRNTARAAMPTASRLQTPMIAVLALLLGAACSGPHETAATSDAAKPSVAKPGPEVGAAAQTAQAAPPPAAAGDSLLDACALVGQANADAVLGTPAKIESHQEDRHSSHCSYLSVDTSHGVNGFGVSIHNDESVADAKAGQAMKLGLYSNFQIYDAQVLQDVGEGAFLAVNKPPAGAAFASGPLADLVARQQVMMLYKGARDVEIIVSYFGKVRSSDAVKAMARDLASKI